jgi:ferredoxin
MTETITPKNGKSRLVSLADLPAGPGLIAPKSFDPAAYVEDFNSSVISAYRKGVADAELPADMGVARSLIAPATAGVRDFSDLSPQIPRFVAEKCVGCMACVSACPDSAIVATAQPKAQLAKAIDDFAAGQPNPKLAAETAREHFVHTTKYADVPAKKGIEPADFGLFIDPVHCKGCAECVDVCVAQGHDALVMTEKLDAEPSGESTLERYRRARLRLRRRRRLLLGLRRSHRRADGRRRDASGLRAEEHGHRRRDRLQHRLWQHVPL